MLKTLTVVAAIIAISRNRADLAAAETAERQVVYVVTRCAGAESHALLSARLLALKAANLHWYDGANVLRAEMPSESLAQVRSDPDVILALTEQLPQQAASPPQTVPAATPDVSAVPPPSAGPVPATPLPASGAMPALPAIPQMPPPNGFVPGAPGVGMPMGMPMGMGMGGTAGMVDSLAGMIVSRIMNRPPSCKIDIAGAPVKFAPGGGDQALEVKASGSCAWQAQASVPWIKIASGSGASGAGVVSYTVTASEGKARAGAILIVAAPGGSPIKGNATAVVTQSAN